MKNKPQNFAKELSDLLLKYDACLDHIMTDDEQFGGHNIGIGVSFKISTEPKTNWCNWTESLLLTDECGLLFDSFLDPIQEEINRQREQDVVK